jgi:hypothetical protein
MKRLLALTFAAGATLAGQDMASVKEDFQFSYALNPNGRVSIETFNGSLEVYSWDRNEVEIVGTKYAPNAETLRELRVDTTNTPDSVSVRAYRPKSDSGGWWRTGNTGVRMVVRVPRRVQLERVSTSNGEVRVSGIEGNVRASTSNGAVRITNVTGRLEASTSNGRIEASGVAGELTLRTSNGAIDVTAPGFRGPIEASTSNGAITLRLAGGVHADLRATTSNGRVSSDYEVTTRGSLEKNRLEGRIGEGGPPIRLSSSNGAIRIVKI